MTMPLEPCFRPSESASSALPSEPCLGPSEQAGGSFEALRQLIPTLDGMITNKRIREMTHVSRQGICLVLAELVTGGILSRFGQGRAVYYLLAERTPRLPEDSSQRTPPHELSAPSAGLAQGVTPLREGPTAQDSFPTDDATHSSPAQPQPPKGTSAVSTWIRQSTTTAVRSPLISDRQAGQPAGGSPALLTASQRRMQAETRILDLVSAVDTVRDLTTSVPLPRRTLQRVLSAMLKSQVLMAEGATRRRRYFLPVSSDPLPM